MFDFVINNKLLKKGSVIIIEESIDQNLNLDEKFEKIERKVYGKTQVLFLKVI